MQSGYRGYCVFTINVTSLKPDVRQATINGSEGCQWTPDKHKPPRHNTQQLKFILKYYLTEIRTGF